MILFKINSGKMYYCSSTRSRNLQRPALAPALSKSFGSLRLISSSGSATLVPFTLYYFQSKVFIPPYICILHMYTLLRPLTPAWPRKVAEVAHFPYKIHHSAATQTGLVRDTVSHEEIVFLYNVFQPTREHPPPPLRWDRGS